MILGQFQLGGVLDGDDRSSVGMKLESTLSSVVLPDPVPPATTMFQPRTARSLEERATMPETRPAEPGPRASKPCE